MRYADRVKAVLWVGVGIIVVAGLIELVRNNGAVERGHESRAIATDVETAQVPLPITLVPRDVQFADGSTATFRLPAQFSIAVAAEDLGKARFSTMSPDGRLFVPDMVNFEDNTQGSIYILDDWNTETHRFESRSTYLTGLRNPHSLAFYTDTSGNQWLYIALTDRLIRYPYAAGDTAPSGEPELLLTFPDYRTVDNDVWHITRTLLFREDELFVSVGSSCNICEEPLDEYRAEILVMTPTGENVRTYASGIKNAVGMTLADGELYATENGVDHLGPDAPDDVLYRVEEGAHYGWPYCYELNGESRIETEWNFFREPVDCSQVPLSFASFGPHTAPLGVTYFETAHPLLSRTFLVALHGSFRVEIGNGYELVRVQRDGTTEVFMDGFLLEGNERSGRPVHVLEHTENAFFLTDDYNGRLYYIFADSQ